MIKEMTKVQIIGPKRSLDECIRALHATSVVHIETAPYDTGPDAYIERLPMEKEKLREKEALEAALERLGSLTSLLKKPAMYTPFRAPVTDIPAMLEEVSVVEEKAVKLRVRIDELVEELSAINKYDKVLKGFAPIVSRISGLKDIDMVGLTVEKTREDVTGLIDTEIDRITGGSYEMHVRDLDTDTIGVVLTYPKKFDTQVRYLLTGKSINEIRVPDEYSSMSIIDALKLMDRRRLEIPRLVEDAEREIHGLSVAWYGTLEALTRAVNDAIDEIGALVYAAQTRFAFVIEGWLPADMFVPLQEKFTGVFGPDVLVRELEIKSEDMDLVPVCIRNPRILRPFEVFLTALPPPKYGSVDPTPYVALFFPAFFGLIVGDVGYGIVIFIVSLLLRRWYRRREGTGIIGDIFSVLMVSSLSAVVFGILFGEFFGDLGTRLGIMHTILLHRVEALKTFMVLTLGIGAGHVTLGLVIGAVNRFYRGKTREAGGKLAYLALIASFIFMIGILSGYLPAELTTPGIAALIVSFVVLVVFEGFFGPLEFIKTIGNILSYVRIMAVGTASVVMAIVANRIGGLTEDLVLGIIVACIIHTLNIILSVVSPSIQAMRLQYVEFFSKFYVGAGRKYEPFKKR